MKKYFLNMTNLLLLTAALIYHLFNISHAASLTELATLPNNQNNTAPALTPAPPIVDAQSYILVDANSGKVLAENNADVALPPASLTKIMTVYLASEALKNEEINLEDKVRISKNAWQTEGSKMFIKEGQLVEIYDLLQGIVIQSGNDASVAVAEYIAGSEETFTELMNQQAMALGMQDSHFTNSTGLPDPDLYMTARDLAILSRALILNHPEDYQWHKQKWFTFNGIKQPNRNRLLWRDPDVDGIKTGHTEEAGYSLVSSAQKDGMRLIAVIMNSPGDEARTNDSQRLLAYGFRFFETEKFYQARQPLAIQRIWKGQQKSIPIGLNNDLYLTIPRGQYKNLKAMMEIPQTLYAPVAEEQTIGKVNILLDDEVIASQPLIALATNQKGNLWTRISDSVGLTFQKWFSTT